MPIKPLFDAGTIAERVAELGEAITQDYAGKNLVVVPVLKGSYVFAADLVRHIDLDVAIEVGHVEALGVEAHDEDGVRAKMPADRGEHGGLGLGCDVRDHVAGHDCRVEQVGFAQRGEVHAR